MREIIFQAWCDACWADGREKTVSVQTWTVGVVAGETRPSLHTVEACEAHGKTLADVLALIGGLDLFSPAAQPPPAKSEATPQLEHRGVTSAALDARASARVRAGCPLCEQDMASGSVVQHLYARHLGMARRPTQPNTCPDCGLTAGSGQAMAIHRQTNHGYDSLIEALALVAAAPGPPPGRQP